MKKFFKQTGKGLLYFILFFGTQVILTIIYGIIFSLSVGIEMVQSGQELDAVKLGQEFGDKLIQSATLLTSISGILILIILYIRFKTRRKNFFEQISIKPVSFKYLGAITAFGLCFGLIVSFLMAIIKIPEDMMSSYVQSSEALTKGNLFVNLFCVVIIAPLVEEVVLRGLVYTRFKKGMPTVLAVILSSLLFGVLHGDLLWIIYATILGGLLCIVFEITGSLLGSIALHFGFNLFGGISMALNIDEVPDAIAIIMLGVSVIVCVLSAIFILKIKDNSNELIETTEEKIELEEQIGG
jgi:membrane protease YdiL (CAAX protease family)